MAQLFGNCGRISHFYHLKLLAKPSLASFQAPRSFRSMSVPTKDAVSTKLHDLLRVADLNVTTERSLLKDLTSHFGVPMDGFSELVKSEVSSFVNASSTVDPPHGTKRSRDEVDAIPGTSAARAVAPDEGVLVDHPLTVDGKTRIQVKKFKGDTFVDLRSFWEKDGKLLPTKKGLMLSRGDWAIVADHLAVVVSAVQEKNVDFAVPLSGTRKITVDAYRGAVSANMREWYEEGGEMKPGKSGVKLNAASLQALVECAPSVSAAAGPLQASAMASASTAAPSSAPAAAASVPAVAPPPAQGQAAHPADAAGGTSASITSGTGDTIWKLGEQGSKFASVSQFKGKWMVGLREFYQKDGKWMPGKKGISLSAEQFQTLCANEPALSDAIASKNESYSLELAPMRKASVSSFKGTYYVNIREYYAKDGGQLAPGAKGIALTREQWSALTVVVATLKERMDCAW